LTPKKRGEWTPTGQRTQIAHLKKGKCTLQANPDTDHHPDILHKFDTIKKRKYGQPVWTEWTVDTPPQGGGVQPLHLKL